MIHCQKGDGFFEDLVKRPISTIGGVVLPALGGVAGGTLGTALSLNPIGTVLAGAAGSTVGREAANYLKSIGLGKKKRRMRGGEYTFGLSQVGMGTGHASYLGNNTPTKFQTALPGQVFGLNGIYYPNPTLIKQKGSGLGEYNTISNAYGRVQM